MGCVTPSGDEHKGSQHPTTPKRCQREASFLRTTGFTVVVGPSRGRGLAKWPNLTLLQHREGKATASAVEKAHIRNINRCQRRGSQESSALVIRFSRSGLSDQAELPTCGALSQVPEGDQRFR